MSEDARTAAPFSPRAALAVVTGGIVLFFLVLWLIGSGMGERKTNNGGAHAGSKGLTGYAAFAGYLAQRGFTVTTVRSAAALRQPGALVLTPPAGADPKDLERVVLRRRSFGPTLIVVPKWNAMPPPVNRPDAKTGWVMILGAGQPHWPGFYDDIYLALDRQRPRQARPRWSGAGLDGTLPDGSAVASGRGDRLIPLVATQGDARVLAAYVADGGDYPGLRALALADEPPVDEDEAHGDYPVIFVFEPDLIDNYGLSRAENALLGERIVAAALEGGERRVAFDLTFNGFARSRNLLTLAFEPPFLAATLCLMLAALVLGWRAFNRFGPALLTGRALAFGKTALVANAAGLIRRTRRLHLIGGPYADAAQGRLSRALALPARLGGAETEAAIDRALAARKVDGPAFSVTAAALRRARRPTDLLRAARTLHRLERTLTK
ncbi:hypothetical protein B0I00_1378 [Novosphingobium kunmingense]|uniref:DUF4350 domain-containing protein n=1 Tax=Novosphingobium kunmingense TaxID=1211806 RepID=A0A2N0HJQ2_9SPHN|nr:hypothetical protein [Novosphingobium kunmingense]PKB19149.1 hypothetical protein B0I00_1378 [Novosphingobium kunmingense]